MGVFKNKSGQTRSGWLILLLAILLFLFIFLFQFLVYFSIKIMDIELSQSTETFLLGMSTQIAMLLSVIVMWVFIQKNSLREIGLKGNGSGWKEFFWGFGLGAVSMLVVFLILLGTGAIRVGNGWNEPDFSSNILVFLVMFIFVGFTEEFLFRGYVMKTMEQRKNPMWFIFLFSSILFSFAHMGNMHINYIALLNIFLVGLLFAYMFRITGSLWMPIGYHISWNYTQGNIFGFPVSGNPVDSVYRTQMVVGQEWLSGGGFGPEGGFLVTILIGLGMLFTWIYGKKTTPPMVDLRYKNKPSDLRQ